MFIADKDGEIFKPGKTSCWALVKPYSQAFVWFRCPSGHLNNIECPPYHISNTKDSLGSVTPEVECKHSGMGCDFKRFITLQNWEVLFKD